MRRDDDYIRNMMLKLEASDDTLLIATNALAPDEDEDEDEEKSYYHAQILRSVDIHLEAMSVAARFQHAV